LLVLAGLAVAGGFWWRARKLPVPVPVSKPISVAQPTQVVIQPKPAPVKPPPEPARLVIPIPPPRLAPKARPELPPPGVFPRPVQDVFEAQLALARHGISSGSLDGRIGPQTRSALRAFQQKEHLPVTGELDVATQERLLLTTPAYTNLIVTANDLARLQPLSAAWLGKSQQSALDYETILELVAERGHAHPSLIRQLNPSIDWTNIVEGTMLQLPDVAYAETNGKAAFVTISLSAKILEVFDANTNLLAHFPCSIAQRVEKRPVGELHVAVIAPNPNYTFDPDIFPESAEARQIKSKLILPPGPNNPVGVAWIGLDKSGYGIHGTPSPEQVGRTESHGCFRLANWNAEYLVKLVWVGMPVYVEP
jgi:lipoprotein-anchoring transpeptidase ErfK/SrfK